MENINEEIRRNTRNMMKSSYGDDKLDKSNELNATMSIQDKPMDELERKLHNLGGTNNAI